MKKLFTILVSLLVTASVYSQTYEVNKFYPELGGYVIEVIGGKYGLVVSMKDQGTSTWYNYDALINNPANYDEYGSKFSDWRLPTLREYNIMCKIFNNGNAPKFNSTYYWTSQENSAAGSTTDGRFAVHYNMGNCGSKTNNKVGVYWVRGIRVFGTLE